jgi:Aspartyl/Asparaginyl beta-hydroxylase
MVEIRSRFGGEMFEQAFKNIDNVLRNELGITTEVSYIENASDLSFREYFDGLEQNEADQAKPLLEQLERVADEPDYALARYLFAAAASEPIISGRVPMEPPSHFSLVAKAQLPPFLAELAEIVDCKWGKNSRHKISVQRETRSISLSVRATRNVSHRHDQYVRLHNEYARQFPHLVSWLQNFAKTVGNGTLQLARIVKLEARGQVYMHVDRGLYYLVRDRYHLVLQSVLGSKMQCGGQTSIWHPGQVWWFNNHIPHQAFNDSEHERIHVIFDVLPYRNKVLIPYFQRQAISSER